MGPTVVSGSRTGDHTSVTREAGGQPHLRGRRPGDRRVRVKREHSPYFRYGAPGVLTTKAAALVESPYRALLRPLIRFLEFTGDQAPDEVVVVILPEYVPRHWWERFLYNENTRRIRADLLGRPNLLVAEVPFRRDV